MAILLLAGPGRSAPQLPALEDGLGADSGRAAAPLRIERGEGQLPILVPADEVLIYDVHLSFGVLGNPRVGTVTLTSKVEPYLDDPLLLRGQGGETGERRATVSARAEGRYAVYELESLISTTMLPQEWPSRIHRERQRGTENRERELLFGHKDGGPFSAQFRRDGHCKECERRSHFVKPTWAWQDEHHCGRCRRAEHRVWREPTTREAPEGSLDMLSAVLLARQMVRESVDQVSFTLLDKLELWEVTLQRGKQRRYELAAGTFDLVGVELATRPPEGAKGRADDFEGLFGIQGSIFLGCEPKSGTPVLIRGEVPAGPVLLDVTIELSSYSGTPSGFGPVE
jgi:hypothetical protein